jgi:5,6-dimethylbenzimidazole synthase
VKEFAEKPDLEKIGWLPRVELGNVIYYEQWGVSTSHSWSEFCNIVDYYKTNH